MSDFQIPKITTVYGYEPQLEATDGRVYFNLHPDDKAQLDRIESLLQRILGIPTEQGFDARAEREA